jgi:His Kinase A (phospho-acceptor) domain/PAS domain
LEKARRLLAHERAASGADDSAAAAAGRVYDKLHAHLAPLVGAIGVQALFVRSAKLTQGEFGGLAEVSILEGSTKLREHLQAQAARCGFVGRQPELGDTDERFCGSFKLFRPDGSFMPHEQCPMAEVVDGKRSEVVDAEVLIERPDGSRITVVVNIRPLKNQRGEVTGAINCFYDISERKRAENQLADSMNRERELAEFREKFMGILGHDLRNPLASIIMSAAALLRRAELGERDAEKATVIIRGGQRMQRMITQLLDFTRARLGGGFPIEPKPADLGEVCRNVVEEFEANIQLEVEGDVTGTWDEDRLAEVLSNLVGNAIAYARPGTPVLVKAHAQGAEVVVEVINQGEPLPRTCSRSSFSPSAEHAASRR